MFHRTRLGILLSQSFRLASVILGISHIVFITITYFHYPTTTRITLDKRQRIVAPTLVTCVRYLQVLNYSAVNQQLGLGDEDRKIPGQQYQDKMTVSDIFSHTPATDHILSRCTYRLQEDKRAILSHSRDCSFFSVTKFVMQSFVCYSVYPVNRTEFLIDELASSYNFEHTVYKLDWDRVFNSAKDVFVILTDTTYPHRSRAFGSLKLLDSSADRNSRSSSSSISAYVQNKITKVRLLPAPYDTMCTPDYSLFDKTSCLIRKMDEAGLHRVPNTEILTLPYDVKQVQTRDEANETMRAILDHIYDQCNHEEATAEKCIYTVSETDARFFESETGVFVTFRVMSPNAANTLIVSRPAFQTAEYLLYICSCCGIWFGISVQDFNPSNFWPKLTGVSARIRHFNRRAVHLNRIFVPLSMGPWRLISPMTQILSSGAKSNGSNRKKSEEEEVIPKLRKSPKAERHDDFPMRSLKPRNGQFHL